MSTFTRCQVPRMVSPVRSGLKNSALSPTKTESSDTTTGVCAGADVASAHTTIVAAPALCDAAWCDSLGNRLKWGDWGVFRGVNSSPVHPGRAFLSPPPLDGFPGALVPGRRARLQQHRH